MAQQPPALARETTTLENSKEGKTIWVGYNIVRLDMLWPWFEPRPGDYNPAAFQQLEGEHRGYVVAVNHSAETQDVNISPSFVARSLSRITASGQESL